jgi:CubicO group peptidase (beta-lactamase class C family)
VTEPPAEFVEFLDSAVARHDGTGVVAVAAIEDSDIAWTAAAGGPVDTVFQAGSLSKTVTSAVALELVGRGELELDRESGLGATLRDLLGHTAGTNVPFYPGYAQDSTAPTLAQSLGGVEPAATPAVEIDPKWVGRFRYSGGSYALVQQLIEDVSGMPFAEAARKTVLDPIPMPSSTFLQPAPEPLLASAARADWRIYPESAAAGLWTTADDLARFVCALQTAEAFVPMTTAHVRLPSGGQWRLLKFFGLEPPRNAGLGLFLRDGRFINLGGAAESFSALAGSIENGKGAVVMTTGCRSPLAVRTLLELADTISWSGVRRSRHRRTSDFLLRTFS